MKLTIKQQLDTHDKLIAKLLHGLFEGSEVALEQSERTNAALDFVNMLNMRMDGIREMISVERTARNKALKRLQWVVIAQGLSLLAIVYLLWLKL